MNWKENLRVPELTSEAFTKIMAEAARERLDAGVQVTAPLELHVDVSERMALQCNLRGLWQKDIKGSGPENRQAPCEEYLQGLQERIEQQGGSGRPVVESDPSDLRPILQSRSFVD